MTTASLKKLDQLTKKTIQSNQEYIDFFTPFFPTPTEAQAFIVDCLKKLSTRRMMLRVIWYANIADDIPKINPRTNLQISFLIALSENISKRKYTKKHIAKHKPATRKLIDEFFHYMSPKDKHLIESKVRRALTRNPTSKLRFKSIIDIFYDIRNDTFHGEEYWSFSFKKRGSRASMIVGVKLGKRYKKRPVTLDVSLTYEEFRNIIVQTSINNIKACM